MQSVILGTAQWGLDYGVTNVHGRLSDDMIGTILQEACEEGVGLLDTSPAYGDAESRIGVLATDLSVQTKVYGEGLQDTAQLSAALAASARRLRRWPSRVIVHDWPSLNPVQRLGVARGLETLRDSGRVSLVGISGYDGADLEAALDCFRQLDLAQLPVSVLDQRLFGSDEVTRLREAGGLLQARSVYLQGAALAHDNGALHDHPDIQRLDQVARDLDASTQAVCASFVQSQQWVDEVVLGVTSGAELRQWFTTPDVRVAEWGPLASSDIGLLDPRRWK